MKVQAMIELDDVTKIYETPAGKISALDGVSARFEPGQMVALMGPSGSGKSTLLNVIAGLSVPTSGTVVVGGQHLDSLGEKARSMLRLNMIGMIFQDDNLIAEFSAVENVSLPLIARGASLKKATEIAEASMLALDVQDLRDRFPTEMSGGQKQRIGIARALANDQRVILADEPTGALDSQNARNLFSLLRDTAKSGATVLVATHDSTCQEFADTLCHMSDGRLT